MFHVERSLSSIVNTRKIIIFVLFFVVVGCDSFKQNIQITDYILAPNGKEIIGNKALTAFIFENNKRGLPIEEFISLKYKSENIAPNEFWISIDENKYKLIIYDYSEFEKYFQSSNYAVINLEPENVRTGDKRDYIAISIINAYNEDCLKDTSLFQNTTLKYLKKLKQEYYNQ